jgi:hypothetical protein
MALLKDLHSGPRFPTAETVRRPTDKPEKAADSTQILGESEDIFMQADEFGLRFAKQSTATLRHPERNLGDPNACGLLPPGSWHF